MGIKIKITIRQMNRIALATLSLIASKAAADDTVGHAFGDLTYTERMPQGIETLAPVEAFPARCELSGVKVCMHPDFTFGMVLAELQYENCASVTVKTNAFSEKDKCEAAQFDSKVTQIQGFRTKKRGTHNPVVSGLEFTSQSGRKYAVGDTEPRSFQNAYGQTRTIVAQEIQPVQGWINGLTADKMGLINFIELDIVSNFAHLKAKEQWVESTEMSTKPDEEEEIITKIENENESESELDVTTQLEVI